jgi:hypothetical protein
MNGVTLKEGTGTMQSIRHHEIRIAKLHYRYRNAAEAANPENPYVHVLADVLIEVETEHEELDHQYKISVGGLRQKEGTITVDPESGIQFESHPQTVTRRRLGGSVEVTESGMDQEIGEFLFAAFAGRPLTENFDSDIYVEVDTLLDRGSSRRVAVKAFALDKDRMHSDIPDACWVVDMKISSWSEYGNQFLGAEMELLGESIDQNLPFNLCRQAFPELDM